MPDRKGQKYPENIFLHLRSIHRLFIGFAVVLITWLLLHKTVPNPLILIMILWDVFCIAILLNAWIVFLTCSPARIRKIASKEDGSRLFVFVIVLVSSLASMVTVLMLILSKNPMHERWVYLGAAIGGMLLSWVMVHTTFCFHYAYMYYGDDDDDDDKSEMHGGLEFPGRQAPDYLDFAYFSFVIGMTFQVSDVEISSRSIRRQVLLHGLLSFALNTFVVALTVNLVAGLKA